MKKLVIVALTALFAFQANAQEPQKKQCCQKAQTECYQAPCCSDCTCKECPKDCATCNCCKQDCQSCTSEKKCCQKDNTSSNCCKKDKKECKKDNCKESCEKK